MLINLPRTNDCERKVQPGRAARWLAAIVLLALATQAGAQVTGLYYQEIEKDGRIYVFNTPERVASFKASGEMGTGITLIGRGANGETLIGENETAIDLYLFRHNLPAYERPTPKPTPTPVAFPQVKASGLAYISYQNGQTAGVDYSKTVLKRGYFGADAKITSYLSARAMLDVTQDSTGDWKARFKYLYGKFDLGTAAVFNKNYIEFGLAHMPWLDFEEHVNYYRLQDTMFMERNNLFNSADMGVMWGANLGADMPDDYLKNVNKAYAGRWGSIQVGVYDGAGYHAAETNTNKVIEGRLTIRPLPDLVPGLQVTYFGINGKGNKATEPDWSSNTGMISYESRWLVVTGQYVDSTGNQGGSAVDASGKSVPQKGWSGFVEGKLSPTWSVIGRYDQFDPNSDVDNNSNKRSILGVAYKFNANNMLLLDYDQVNYDQAGKPTDKRTQLTLQVSF
jgi:hypothetical protein